MVIRRQAVRAVQAGGWAEEGKEEKEEEEKEEDGGGARGDMFWPGVVRLVKENKKQVGIKMKERVSPFSSKQP